jgi:predicted O-methyltransferase YrrM
LPSMPLLLTAAALCLALLALVVSLTALIRRLPARPPDPTVPSLGRRGLRSKGGVTASKRRQRVVLEGQREVLAQVEALIDLYATTAPRIPMPSTQGWASAPTTMRALIGLVHERRPSTIVECGSGSSSIWLGHALRQLGRGRIISLEHLPEYAEATRNLVHKHGLDELVEVRLAPLKPVTLASEEFQWYDPAALQGVEGVDLIFVDGPPGDSCPMARFPALPMLKGRCNHDAVVLVDDTARPDEARAARRWIKEYGAKPLSESANGTGWRSVVIVGQPRS